MTIFLLIRFPHYIKQLIESEFELEKLPGRQEDINCLLNQKPVLKDSAISFSIIYFNAFGNAYTNLTKKFFEDSVKNRKFKINLGRFDWVKKLIETILMFPKVKKFAFLTKTGTWLLPLIAAVQTNC